MTYHRKTKPALWLQLKPTEKSSGVRKPVRKVSKARAKELRKYRAWVKQELRGGRHCQAIGTGWCKQTPHLATEYHHSRGRAGQRLHDKDGFFVCHEAHMKFHRYPKEARAFGWFKNAWLHQPKEKTA